MKYPLAFISIPIMLGVIFTYYIEVSLSVIFALLFLCIVLSLIAIKLKGSGKAGLALALVLVGMLLTNMRLDGAQLLKYLDKPLEIVAEVEDVVEVDENRTRLIIRTQGIRDEGEFVKVSEKSILNIIGKRDIRVGDRIRFTGVLKEPLPNTNPRLYNYKLNLLSHGIFTSCTIRDHAISGFVRDELDFLTKFRLGARDKIEEILDLYLKGDSRSIMKSILLGSYRYLEEEQVQTFRDLGLAHIIAVSGLHIGILTSLLIYLFAYMGIKREVNIAISIALIWAYGYIIGFPVSVVRANIMYTVLFSSQLLKKPYDSINSLFFALLLLMFINPFWIFHVGFQLSYVATFSVVYFTPKISMIFGLPRTGLFSSLASIVAAQIGILPLLAYYFNRLPMVGIVANLILVPLFNICLVMTILLIPMSFISGQLASSIGILVGSIVNLQSLGMNVLSYFPILYIRARSPYVLEIIFYYIIIFVIFGISKLRNIKRRAYKLVLVFLVSFLLTNQILISIDDSILVEFIDVGQGDSVLIRSKKGAYLIDTGGDIFGQYDVGENTLVPYLEKQGIFKLKGVFISHFHEDHCNSLPYLMDHVDIDNIYVGYVDDDNDLYREIKEGARRQGISINVLKRGNLLSIDDNTHLLVLGPDKDLLSMPIDDNDLSLVLLMKHFDNSFLFTGDIEHRGEVKVVETLDRGVDLLKVPHHGSNTSSSQDFLEKLKPKAAFVSVGRNNMFGHPHGEVVKRYEELNIALYRTDESGLIRVYLRGDGFAVDTFLKEKPDLIHIIKTYNIYISQIIICSIVIYVAMKYYIKVDEELKKIELEGV
ncbi:MAG: DNA internalization-related competence protein ComEC/Rec2 [Tissierellia bacterium]|nr:DNA internalization-related competence protein ComEC/Rec2 [Tissierellia bacterium]